MKAIVRHASIVGSSLALAACSILVGDGSYTVGTRPQPYSPGSDGGVAGEGAGDSTTGSSSGTGSSSSGGIGAGSGSGSGSSGTGSESGTSCSGGSCCGPRPGGGVCSVAPECGCAPDSGTPKCSDHVDGGVEECVANGNTPPYSPCTSDPQCEEGYLCLNGLCSQVCPSGSTCSQVNWDCVPIYIRGTTTPAGYGACNPHCNPLSPRTSDSTHAVCPAGQTCLPSGHTQGATFCEESTGNGVTGSSCSATTDCVPGDTCGFQGDASLGECLPWCDVSGTVSGCTSGTCTAYSNSQPYDYSTELGLCTP
ncbi:MAG: hypothetical protein ACLP1X_00930 [Polyangiaceae bacterium]